jgi:hypothetical protein
MSDSRYDDLFEAHRQLTGFKRYTEPLETEGGDPMSSNVSDDITAEITCMECGKKFVINTVQIGAMTICPHCNTVMIAQLDEDTDEDTDETR